MDNYYSSGWNIGTDKVLTPLYPDRNGPFCKLEGDLKFGYTIRQDESEIGVSYHIPKPGDSVYWYYGMEHNIFGSEAHYSSTMKIGMISLSINTVRTLLSY